jgi:hypothetical protein
MPIAGSSIYEIDGRKYIDIDGMRIKIPFRYGHISGVTINGFKSLYELKQGDLIEKFEMNKKLWNGEVFYVLKSITF